MTRTLRRRRSKFNNRRVRLPGEARSFDSQHEAREWQKLKILEERGKIFGLTRQVTYSLDVNGQHICNYRADFEWHTMGPGTIYPRTVADAKGYPTPEYKIKKALMKAIHGIEIREL